MELKGEKSFISLDGPIVGYINPSNEKDFYIMLGIMGDGSQILMAKSDKAIEHNLDNLEEILKLEFKDTGMVAVQKEDPQTTIAILLPLFSDTKMKAYFADVVDQEYKNSYLIPANKAAIIFCNNEKHKIMESRNDITTLTSSKKNMHLIFSEKNEGTDYIIENYQTLPVFVDKSDQDQTISMKNYPPKYTFFGAENPYLFNAFYSYGSSFAKVEGINLNNYFKLTQMNLRINSKYLPWYEYYNFYFNQLDIKINIYIKQLYGGSDIYECDARDVSEKDFRFLLTPISNTKCKKRNQFLIDFLLSMERKYLQDIYLLIHILIYMPK